MSSVIEICNMALSRIGVGQRIDDLDEASSSAEQCNAFYEHSRDFVLRADNEWGFATAFADLAQVEVNPDPTYRYAYAMPIDCLRIRRIVSGVFNQDYWPDTGMHCYYGHTREQATPYRVINSASNRLISTNANPAKLEYTVKVESPELFDPVFVSALAWKLASNIAPALSKDPGIAANCEGQYQLEIMRARTVSLNEGAQHRHMESSFIRGRC